MTLTVVVDGLVPDGAPVVVSVFSSEERFPDRAGAAVQRTVAASAATVTVRFDDLPPGRWAVTVHHDQDADGELDFRWLPPGPAEGTSASCPSRPFAMPRWSVCSFDTGADTVQHLAMWY